MDDLQRITKQQLVAFANKAYKNNYVVVYKKQGASTGLVKVENPKITPILLNENKESAWGKNLEKTKVVSAKPEFIDYKKAIQNTTLSTGLSIAYVRNEKNDLFQLDVIFDMGKSTDKRIPLAVNYINFIGTTAYSSSEWNKEFYKLGASFNFSPQNGRTIFHIEGFLESDIKLLNHILDNLVPDQKSYDRYIQSILNSRKANTGNRTSIRQALFNYALYNDQSSLRDIYSEQELKSIHPKELTDLVKNLRDYKHRIFYYGNDLPRLKNALKKFYEAPYPVKDPPISKTYYVQSSKPIVYFVNYEGAQAEVGIITRGEKFDLNTVSLSNMFDRFIEKVNFQEIREARSLAYDGWAIHLMSDDTVNYDHMEIFGKTQVNKLNEFLKAGTELMKDISGTGSFFTEAKTDQLKRYQRERMHGIDIFWNNERLKKQGIDYDIRKNIYRDIQQMSFKDMQKFFQKNIANRNLTIVVVGDKKDIDMNELAKYGEVKEMDVNYLFNYR